MLCDTRFEFVIWHRPEGPKSDQRPDNVSYGTNQVF